MVNNIIKIRTMLSFADKDDFYFVQVLKRRKDNPDLSRDMIIINNYYIESMEQYDKITPQMIKICDAENARAYFRLNKRNYKHLSYHMLKRVVEVISSGAYKSLKGSFDSVTGEHHNDKNKTWVVDVDYKDFEQNVSLTTSTDEGILDKLCPLLEKLQKEAKRNPLLEILPTKNGLHIITRPFNLQVFRKDYPKMDVHRDNPTILYCP
jgi:hypothetical protein